MRMNGIKADIKKSDMSRITPVIGLPTPQNVSFTVDPITSNSKNGE